MRRCLSKTLSLALAALMGTSTILMPVRGVLASPPDRRERRAIEHQYLLGLRDFLSSELYLAQRTDRHRLRCLRDPSLANSDTFCREFLYGKEQLSADDLYESAKKTADESETGEATDTLSQVHPYLSVADTLNAFKVMRLALAKATPKVTFDPVGPRGVLGNPLFYFRTKDLRHLFDRYRLNGISRLPDVPTLADLVDAELSRVNAYFTEIITTEHKRFIETGDFYPVDEDETEADEATDRPHAGLLEMRQAAWDANMAEVEAQQAALDAQEPSCDLFAEDCEFSLGGLFDLEEKQRRLDEEARNRWEWIGFDQRYIPDFEALKGIVLENSKELHEQIYYATIQQFPVLAFLTMPEDRIAQLYSSDTSPDAYFPYIADALEHVIEINEQFRDRLKNGRRADSRGELLYLMSLNPLVEAFFTEETHDVEIVESLISQRQRVEAWNKGLSILGAVAWGIGCGAILNFTWARALKWTAWAASTALRKTAIGITCALTSGIGLNLLFYDQAFRRYENIFRELFSQSGFSELGEDGALLLQEISELKKAETDLLYETIFVFVGTGAFDAAHLALSARSQRALQSWLRARQR